ncbi:hypothetical protein AB0B01_12575 [Streptomyces sp. NPDC044571]|uniref:hypothetical protein n=1 Tax=Streptomyces sp. NPDC044571 TaxID=3155371 RepID=UPI0033E4117D
MTREINPEDYIGMKIVSPGGQYVGEIGSVFASAGEEQSEKLIAAVSPHRQLGEKLTLWRTVPLEGAHMHTGGELTVPYRVEQVHTSPAFSYTPETLDVSVSRKILAHYGRDPSEAPDLAENALISPPGALKHDTAEEEQCIPGIMAWQVSTEEAGWAQAAQLVGLGMQLSGHHALLKEWEADAKALLLPRFDALGETRIEDAAGKAIAELGLPLDIDGLNPSTEINPEERAAHQQALWWECQFNNYGAARGAALVLLLLGLSAPHQVVRVTSASELLRLTEKRHALVDLLRSGCMSDSQTVREISVNALARFEEEHESLSKFQKTEHQPGSDDPSHSSITIHGTWAAFNSWWQPNSDLSTHIRAACSPDLWNAPNPFTWAGGYNNAARQRAASRLRTWTANNLIRELKCVYAHSHGANVALESALEGVQIRLLVLLHPAIVRRSVIETDRILRRVGRILAFCTRWDIVILSDRAIRLFPSLDPRIEVVYRGWFDHSRYTSKDVWEKLGIADKVGAEMQMVDPNFPVP